MENKVELLFGMVYLSKGLFNVLYTLLCVVYIVMLLASVVMATSYIDGEGADGAVWGTFSIPMIWFIMYKIFDSKNYA